MELLLRFCICISTCRAFNCHFYPKSLTVWEQVGGSLFHSRTFWQDFVLLMDRLTHASEANCWSTDLVVFIALLHFVLTCLVFRNDSRLLGAGRKPDRLVCSWGQVVRWWATNGVAGFHDKFVHTVGKKYCSSRSNSRGRVHFLALRYQISRIDTLCSLNVATQELPLRMLIGH